MPDSESPRPREAVARGPGVRVAFRFAVALAWAALLIAFWLGARRADAGPVGYLLTSIDQVSTLPWAPAGLLLLYLLRPLLLVPITVLNLASGFVAGAAPGIALALVGTLLSATVGYGIGRLMSSAGLAEGLAERWPLVRVLRRRGFESVVAGGLMYLHADMVNLPSGLLRIRYPVFLAGIALGNALTSTTAVLTGASVEGSLARATVSFQPWYLALAATLFLISLTLAYWLRKRMRPMG